MTVSEIDLELLEQSLDGALDTQSEAALTARLKTDAHLSAALSELKSQRIVRDAVWQSIEPEQRSVDALVWRVRGAVLDQKRIATAVVASQSHRNPWSSWRIASFGSAAAACLVVGFFAGRAGQVGSIPSQSGPIVSSVNSGTSGTVAVNQTPSPVGQFTRAGSTPQVLVPVSNEYGFVSWQPFDSAEQAKSFEEDLHKSQGGTSGPASGPAKLASQEHF